MWLFHLTWGRIYLSGSYVTNTAATFSHCFRSPSSIVEQNALPRISTAQSLHMLLRTTAYIFEGKISPSSFFENMFHDFG